MTLYSMYHNILPKKDNPGIRGAIVGGTGQFVNAFNLCPTSQYTSMNSTAPLPAGNLPSVPQGSGPDSANPPSAFRPKGPITPTVKGSVKSTKPKPKPKPPAQPKK